MKTELLPKSRQDIIDTTLRHQQEIKVLKYLLLLLIVTVLYENGWPAFSAWGLPHEPASVPSPVQRTMIPFKRLIRLEHGLQGLSEEMPIIRDFVRLRLNALRVLPQRMADPKGKQEAQKNLISALENLWEYFHSPVWVEPEKFAAINQELSALLNMMGKKPSMEVHPPDLDFGPKQPAPISIPKRDIFRFSE